MFPVLIHRKYIKYVFNESMTMGLKQTPTYLTMLKCGKRYDGTREIMVELHGKKN